MSCFSFMKPRLREPRHRLGDAPCSLSLARIVDTLESERKLSSGDGEKKSSGAHSFSFRELPVAIENFKEANLIGEGGFGRVFKGSLETGQAVAIKQLNCGGLQGSNEFLVEGSLENHLFDLPPGKQPPGWNTRIKIALGPARGLAYLHDAANPPVIYCDLKSANILLDDDFNPKLSDFGLAKLGPVGDNTHVLTRVRGTYGYCAPEYAMSML